MPLLSRAIAVVASCFMASSENRTWNCGYLCSAARLVKNEFVVGVNLESCVETEGMLSWPHGLSRDVKALDMRIGEC